MWRGCSMPRTRPSRLHAWATTRRSTLGELDVETPIRGIFTSLPSLKNDAHDPDPKLRHTGQFMMLAAWSTVSESSEGGARPAEWVAFKQGVEKRMISYFSENLQALAPLIVFHELRATRHCEVHRPSGGWLLRTRNNASACSVRSVQPKHASFWLLFVGTGCSVPRHRRLDVRSPYRPEPGRSKLMRLNG